MNARIVGADQEKEKAGNEVGNRGKSNMCVRFFEGQQRKRRFGNRKINQGGKKGKKNASRKVWTRRLCCRTCSKHKPPVQHGLHSPAAFLHGISACACVCVCVAVVVLVVAVCKQQQQQIYPSRCT